MSKHKIAKTFVFCFEEYFLSKISEIRRKILRF